MNDPTVSTQADGLPAGLRSRALLALSAAMFLAVLDAFVANNALPAIATQLAATPSQTVWVANAYQLAMTVSLLPFSSLGDIGGYRRVYLFGLLVFALASLACGLADTLPMLVLARAGQGFGAAGIVSVNMALVRFIYPRAKLGQGMGIIGLVVAAAATSGPSITSAVLAVGPWQYLFLLNVPLGLLTLMLAIRYVPATQGTGYRFDIWSALLNGFGFGSMFIGLDGLGQGRDVSASLIECVVGILTLTVFIRRQLSVAAPMMPVDLFRFPPFAISAAASICANACVTCAFIALPFYFQYAGGRSQIETGLLMTPWPAALVVSAPVADRLSDRYSAGILCGGGLAVLVVRMLLLMQISPEAQ